MPIETFGFRLKIRKSNYICSSLQKRAEKGPNIAKTAKKLLKIDDRKKVLSSKVVFIKNWYKEIMWNFSI